MNEHAYTTLHRLRFLVSGVFVIVCLVSISAVLSAVTGGGKQSHTTRQSSNFAASFAEDPNTVSAGFAEGLDGVINAAFSAQNTVGSVSGAITSATAQSGKAVSDGSKYVALGTYHGLLFVTHTIGESIWYGGRAVGGVALYSLRLPGRLVHSVTQVSAVSAVIRPADHESVPVIDPNSPELAVARAALSTPASKSTKASASVAQPAQPAEPAAIWPLRGLITTQFGEPEPPYQPIHTGIDISDGKPSGTTPVKAFRHGTVIYAQRSGGLGIHVIVDHGSGVTSVYGHLASLSVVVGQVVDNTTTLGYEGTTGVSTGTHLHFEIRVNGQATDPHLFISGQPY